MPTEIEQVIRNAEDLLGGRLGPRGCDHSRRAAETAASLASAYGVSERDAYLAGLLHDWARDLDGVELLAEADRLGIAVTAVDTEVPYLLHAQVGAAQLRDVLPTVGEDVLRAVERHTVGSADMSPLDEVVFVADMLEPDRDFPGVGELRAMVGRVSLEELYLAAYARSLTHVIASRRHLHPSTVPAWNAAVAAMDAGGGR